MHYWLLIFIALALPVRAADAVRVMSLNLCADAYLMAFAKKDQIVALTPQAQDPTLSAFHQQAMAYPVSNGQIEAIAALAPDLVIVSSYSDPLRNRLIEKLGITIVSLDAANSYDAARRDIIKLGEKIGRAREARAYLQALDGALATATATQGTPKPKILPLQRRNLTTGKGHILDEIITLAGGYNQGRAGLDAPMGRISLEHALAAPSDYILLNTDRTVPDSRGMEFLTHPAFKARFDATRRLYIDNNLLVCAGATTPMAVAILARQLSD